MKDKLIKSYISKMTTSDIEEFAIKNNIYLNNQELNYIYNYIKNNYQKIIYDNPDNIFKDLKNNINENSYNKIIDLYFIYKNKYQSFL